MATPTTDQETHMTVIDYQKRGQEPVKELRSTEAYDDFEARLKDKVGKARIQHAYRDWPSKPRQMPASGKEF